ncbi:MAG: alpha/beta fold hydrolase [Nocardioides sp.]|nr:alpha/beta fold hydrolase [Nocardioides sp.]
MAAPDETVTTPESSPDERTTTLPSLTRLDAPGTARGLVLLLHGGKANSTVPVDGRSASWLRLAALQRAITPGAHEAGVSTWLLRYRERGWNAASPVADARWALEQVRREAGDVPVVLLGHSMGGRTAVHVADDPAVAGLVALAPWWSAADPVRTLAGKHVRAAHGRTDKITSYRMTEAYVARAAGVAASASLTDMGRVGHYLLRRAGAWNSFALDSSLGLLDECGVAKD